MRILIISQYFTPEIGGAPVRITAISEALQRSGNEVSVLTPLPNYPSGRTFPGYRRRIYQRQVTNPGVTVHRVWTLPAVGVGPKRYLNYFSFVAMALLPLFRLRRFDLVFVESPPLTTSVLGWIYGIWCRAPFVLNIADLWPDTVVELGLAREKSVTVRLARNLERWSYKKATFVNYVTEGIGRILSASKEISNDRLLFLPNGVDTETFQPGDPSVELARELGIGNRKVFLYAGTHSLGAGMRILVDAAQLLVDDLSIALLLVGDGPAKASIVAEASTRSLENILFLDPVQPAEVAELWNLSMAGLITLLDNPLFEGTRPAKMFPALAAGKPVIYSGSGEGARMVLDHRLGLVTPPEDAGALADAIRHLAHLPRLADELGRNARQYAVRHLRWEKTVGKWLAQLDCWGVDSTFR